MIINFMKYILFVLLFVFSIVLSGQSRNKIKSTNSEEFRFLTDQNNMFYKAISPIIIEGAKYGYQVMRNEANNKLFFENTKYFTNILVLSKIIKSTDKSSYLPKYASGVILKHYFFTGNSIEESLVVKVSTEINLSVYSQVKESEINETFNFLLNILDKNLRSSFKITKNEADFSQKNIILALSENKYDFLESYNLFSTKVNQYGINYEDNRVYRYGKRNELNQMSNGSYQTRLFLGFSQEADSYKPVNKFQEIEKIAQDTNDFLNFKVYGKDLREVNIYNLKEMVELFLNDCKKNNISVPSIETLDATFEPLEGNKIAVSYGLDNNSLIKIKVDPGQWRNSSLQKKWYILYHELGHDVLNLRHGESGKMMFNFADREYTWDEFINDKKYMFDNFKNN